MLISIIQNNISEFGAGSLFNSHFYSEKNDCSPETSIYNFVRAVESGTWKDFHPLICIEDYENSGFNSIEDWIRVLFDADVSLLGKGFVFFHPELYRSTAKFISIENEFLDYLINGSRTGGMPHPFCDVAYASLIGSLGNGPHRYGDPWSEAVGMWPEDVPQMSPFFNPYDLSHALSIAGLIDAESENIHPLRRVHWRKLSVDVHKQVIHSCLSFALNSGDIYSHFTPHTGAQVVDLVARFLMLETSPSAEVKTSICILNYNKLVHTYFCAVSAALNSGDDTEVIVLENGSSSYEAQHLLMLFEKHPKIRLIRSKKNLFFGEGNNVAKDFALGGYVYFLNNDAYVSRDTIGKIVDHMDVSGVAAAGCTFLFPNGYVQEVGGLISDCGQQIQQHKNSSLVAHFGANWESDFVPTQYISSANFCVRRDVLDEIGGYDYIYEPLYFEDTDLCKRITETGREIHLLPNTFVLHVENASTREFLGPNFISQIEKNRAIFKKRWEYKTRGYMPRNVIEYSAAFKRSDAKRPTAYVYSPYPISVGGGERYILSIVRALSAHYNVKFFVPGFVSVDRLAFVMSDLGIRLPDAACISVGTVDEIYTNAKPDIMIVMGNEIVPPIPMIGRVNIHHCQFPFPAQNEDRYEFWRLDNVDALLVNSQFTALSTARNLNAWRKPRHVEVLHPPVQIEAEVPADKHANAANGLNVVSVGRFDPHGHSKNQHIVIEIFNEFQRTHPGAHLTLIGGCSGAEHQLAYIEQLRKSAGPNVTLLVNAPRADLQKHLQSANVYLHACGYGASVAATPEKHEHFGISVVEAMAHGCIPLVYDSGGPAEIVQPGLGWTYKTISECAAMLAQLARLEPVQLRDISKKCAEAAIRYSDDSFDQHLLRFVGGLLQNKPHAEVPALAHFERYETPAVSALSSTSEAERLEERVEPLQKISASVRLLDALWCLRFARYKGLSAAKQAFKDIGYLRAWRFDDKFYKAAPKYKNLRGMDPVVHYVLIGANEGISPDFRFKPPVNMAADLNNPYVAFLKSQKL